MSQSNNGATVTMQQQKRKFTYQNTVMVTLSISSPQVRIPSTLKAQMAINSRIRTQTSDFTRYVSKDLYQQAIQEYEDSQSGHFPFRPYDAVLNYTVTWNQDGLLSMYRDQYEFTGGAHGNTLRSSDTLSLSTGERIPLSSFFRPGTNYLGMLLEAILRQADANSAKEPGIYFENYRDLIVQYFNPESFYLTPQGLCIYYQQYEIAPYSTGIVVFTIPYGSLVQEP